MSKDNLPATEVLAKIDLEAKVTMEDVVNVFLSRFENNLIARRTEIQKELQTLKKSMNDLIAGLRQEHMATARAEMEINPGLHIKEVTMTDINIDEWDGKVKQFYYEVNGTFRKNDKFTFGSRYQDSSDRTWSVGIRFTITEEQQKELDTLAKRRTILKQDLVAVNNELQSIERKARQVRGEIAAKKLGVEGMEALLSDPNLESIIGLPQLPSET